MKLTRLLIPATAVALLLTGCSASSTATAITKDASGQECAVPGTASDAVQVDGEFGEIITLDSKLPIAPGKKIERTVLIDGEGTPYPAGDIALANYSLFNGKTGEAVEAPSGIFVPNDIEQLVGANWAYEAVRCGAPGQRAAIVASVDEVLGGADPAAQGFVDLESTDSFVVVFDFLDPEAEAVEPACDTLTPRDDAYPEVDLGDGTTEPKITIPECMEPPTELELEVLKEGTGAVVQDGEAVMTNYVGVKWNGAERFDGSWNETGVRFPTTGVIQGFRDAMVGQKIGSIVQVTMPPEMGYGNSPGHNLEHDTLTFVLELIELTE